MAWGRGRMALEEVTSELRPEDQEAEGFQISGPVSAEVRRVAGKPVLEVEREGGEGPDGAAGSRWAGTLSQTELDTFWVERAAVRSQSKPHQVL